MSAILKNTNRPIIGFSIIDLNNHLRQLTEGFRKQVPTHSKSQQHIPWKFYILDRTQKILGSRIQRRNRQQSVSQTKMAECANQVINFFLSEIRF